MILYLSIALIGGVLIGVGVTALALRAKNATKNAEHQTRLQEHATKNAEYQTLLQERDRQLAEQRRLLDPQNGALKSTLSELLGGDFERLASRVIDQKTRAFSEQSDRSLRQLLEPFRDQITAFKEQHERQSHRSAKEQQQLSDHITNMQKMCNQLSGQAEELTRALRGDSKVQGDWGEITLQRLLEQLGLRETREYETQVHIPRPNEGSSLRADFVLRLPQQRVVIIDAKVSLTAYTRLVSASNDEERSKAAAEHVQSIRNHIKDLGARRYQYYWKLAHPQHLVEEYVYMFVPIEGVIESARFVDHDLLNYARKQKVIVVNPSITIMLLEALRNMWRIDSQQQNNEKLYIEAGKIHDKCVSFVESMEKIGKHLQQTNNEYDNAVKRLHHGRANLISSTEKLKELGAHTKKELPQQSSRELV